MLRIFLFGSAVVGLLLVTLIYAVVDGHYAAGQPVASPTPGGAGPSASAAASVSVAPGASGSATAVMVMITGSSFGHDLTIAAGTTVMFMNGDPIKHTASNGKDGVLAAASLFDLQLDPGASKSYRFNDPGTYQVTCIVHPTMNMTVTVR